ncbi:hypothetical protein L486_02567 [Kwoniella mangroviensis CBS 10435]|uniref:Phosphatidic acid phosphatase type 2/haloperoxidase domain-containing protein n=1 Tax=Kwoniella mangroviensis CBS 10435 TaxID=1331196 RepID=A0A1B9IWT8_9TREE|nr:uncharacterized protein I203_01594 [Kwoniella mangroviensis CBS 8507]OCF59894.1 hypothetical protein L486_02567 [Kwoniella mangroviensis CBS 10435]OCF69730.1 hypothetical protein I203_01594 [Kwoniella mangroviensis CBS 8507]
MGFLKPHKPSDYPSTLLYILDETHITVTLSTALAILYTRDAHVVWFAVGALNSSLSAKLLKNLIRNPRPPPPDPSSSPSKIRPKRTYGMPSTHSTALTFYFIYLIPYVQYLSFPLSWLAGIGVSGYWVLGLWSRKQLGYHNWQQVLGGALYGTLLALGWKWVYGMHPWIGKGIQVIVDGVCARVFG